MAESNLRRFSHPAVPCYTNGVTHCLSAHWSAKWTYRYGAHSWNQILMSLGMNFTNCSLGDFVALWQGWPLSSRCYILLFSPCLFHCPSISFFSFDDSFLDKSAKLPARLVSGACYPCMNSFSLLTLPQRERGRESILGKREIKHPWVVLLCRWRGATSRTFSVLSRNPFSACPTGNGAT